MNTKRIIFSLVILTLLAGGCAAPVSPAPAAPASPVPLAEVPKNGPDNRSQNLPNSTPKEAGPQPQIQDNPEAPALPAAPAVPTSPSASTRASQGLIGQQSLTQSHPIWPTHSPQDTTFYKPGANPMTDTTIDHLSTFGLDVDTASYTVARKYIREGLLPDPASVRPEEYINYFNQGYHPPADVAFALYADGAPSPFNDRDGAALIRFGIKGYEIPENQRKPLALTFVIDISGSMGMDKRLGLVKRTLELLVDRLKQSDTVSIVVFGSSARVALSVTNGSQRDQILNAVYGLTPEGSTNAGAGLNLGYQMAMQSYQANASNRVILCTDGVANTGITDPDQILASVQGYVSEGIYLTDLGFGMDNFNDYLLERLADKGNGNYAYIDTLEESRSLFLDKLTSTMDVIAKDAKVQVDFNPDVVASYRQIGYEDRQIADRDFRNDKVDAGEIGPGHTVTALYEVYLRPNAQGRLATLQMRWKDPKTDQVSEINGNLNSWDLKNKFSDTDSRYQLSVGVAEFAEILGNNPYTEGRSLSDVQNILAPLRESLGEDADVIELIQLVSQAQRLTPNDY